MNTQVVPLFRKMDICCISIHNDKFKDKKQRNANIKKDLTVS